MGKCLGLGLVRVVVVLKAIVISVVSMVIENLNVENLMPLTNLGMLRGRGRRRVVERKGETISKIISLIIVVLLILDLLKGQKVGRRVEVLGEEVDGNDFRGGHGRVVERGL